MIKLFKKIILIFPLGLQRNIFYYKNRLTRSYKLKIWSSQGAVTPPPHQYKQIIIEQISKKYNLKFFIETGTFLGHMIEAQRKNFLKLYSIEVEPKLFIEAKEKFLPYGHIKIIEGDSALKLQNILNDLNNKSILFWLDGHYSGGITGMSETQCPIYKELECIFMQTISNKYILIDDARCFDGSNDYPTINELTDFVQKRENKLKIKVLNDIIHIY